MKSLNLCVMLALILSIVMVSVAPIEAMAGKDLRITEKQLIVSCNACLNNVDLRFIKDEKYIEMNKIADQWTGSYNFYNGLAPMYLSESSGQLTKIWLTIYSGQKSPSDPIIVQPIDVVNCMASTILSAESDYDRFQRKLKNNLLQGLTKFIIKVKGRSFEVYNSPLGAVILTITPAQ